MVKKTLLSIAIAASVAALAGCNVSTTDKYDDSVDMTPITSGKNHVNPITKEPVPLTQVVYDPTGTNAVGLPNIPLITDLLLLGLGDPTEQDAVDGTIPFVADQRILVEGKQNPAYNPIFSAVTDLDGFSTSSAIDISFGGPLNKDSLVTEIGPKANVLLVPLNYEGDPVLGGAINVAQPFGTPVSITASVVSYTDLENPQVPGSAPITLRIVPNEPLKPATRYLVIITDGVKDAYGYNVKASNTFSLMASSKTPMDAEPAKTLQGAIQQWVSLAVGFTGELGQKNDVGNIAYATTFTTGGTTRVLSAMAAPSLVNDAVAQPLPADMRYTIEKALVDNDGDIKKATGVVATKIGTAAAMGSDTEKVAANALIEKLGGNVDVSGTPAWQLKLGAIVSLAKHLPQPAPRVAEFNGAKQLGASFYMANGSIKLPYYLSAPQIDPTKPETQATAARTITSIWQADNTLATDLKDLLEASGIPAEKVTPPSTKVTRHFPLAKTGEHTGKDGMGLVNVPISVFYDDSCAGLYNPAVYLHGIGGKRINALPFAEKWASVDSCNATVAIDLPLHGLEFADATEFASLYGGNPAVMLGSQRHFGLTANSSMQPTGMTPENSVSGSLFINITNFQATRDNLRQAVMDQLNLNATIPYLSDAAGTNLGINFNPAAKLKFAGHSLGSIVGTNVVALANKYGSDGDKLGQSQYVNKVEAAVLANGGGVLTKLLENSPAFSPTLMGGFAQLGAVGGQDLRQGSSMMELVMHIFQATIDSADPINFASLLEESAENSGVLALEVVGTPECPNAACKPDTVVPPAASEAKGLAPMVLNDLDPLNDKYADTARSALAGTTPLVENAGLDIANEAIPSGSDYLRKVIKYTQGTHGSFGQANSTIDPDLTGAGPKVINDAVEFLKADGKGLIITDTNIVKVAE